MNVACAVPEEGMYAVVMCVLQKAVRMLLGVFGTARPCGSTRMVYGKATVLEY